MDPKEPIASLGVHKHIFTVFICAQQAFTWSEYGTNKAIVEIAQQGNEFVGLKLIQTSGKGKGKETIKGILENDGFKSLKIHTTNGGWQKGKYQIDENCEKIEFKAELYGHTFSINLTKI